LPCWTIAEQRRQADNIPFNTFYVRYYATENWDGKLDRVRKSHKLCRKEGNKYKNETCRAVKNLCTEFMKDKGERIAGGCPPATMCIPSCSP